MKNLTKLLLAAAPAAIAVLLIPGRPAQAAAAGETFTNPNNNKSYQWQTNASGQLVLYKEGVLDADEFVSDGQYTYYCQADGTVMKDQLTYHPNGQYVIYFDGEGHEVFNAFTHVSRSITGDPVDDMCYFNANGYMYTNTVTYDVTGTKLYYINPYGQLEHTGWFTFDPNAGYGDTSEKWGFIGTYKGYANYDGTLLVNQDSFDENGNAVHFQGNGECTFSYYNADQIMTMAMNYYHHGTYGRVYIGGYDDPDAIAILCADSDFTGTTNEPKTVEIASDMGDHTFALGFFSIVPATGHGTVEDLEGNLIDVDFTPYLY